MLKNFLRSEWKTILIFTVFFSSIFSVYYWLEYRPEVLEKPWRGECLRPGEGINNLELGMDRAEIEAILGEKGLAVTNYLNVSRLEFPKSEFAVNFIRDKAVSIEFYPNLESPSRAICEREAAQRLELDRRAGAKLELKGFVAQSYNGWVNLEPIDDESESSVRMKGWIVLRKFE